MIAAYIALFRINPPFAIILLIIILLFVSYVMDKFVELVRVLRGSSE